MNQSHLDAYAALESVRDEGRLHHLDVDACLTLLGGLQMGRVAFNDPHGPLVFPVNYVVDGGTILFRTTMGAKLAAADAHEVVAFQVDQVDRQRDVAWSVLVRGRLVEVTRPEELDRVGDLVPEAFAGGERQHFLRVMPASVTGRAMQLPGHPPDESVATATQQDIAAEAVGPQAPPTSGSAEPDRHTDEVSGQDR